VFLPLFLYKRPDQYKGATNMVTVFGLGFVGLTTVLGLTEKGYPVYGIDPDITRTLLLKNGSSKIIGRARIFKIMFTSIFIYAIL
jgi:UDP-N-acetyl-D-mannosaminuronate dehydrogenase